MSAYINWNLRNRGKHDHDYDREIYASGKVESDLADHWKKKRKKKFEDCLPREKLHWGGIAITRKCFWASYHGSLSYGGLENTIECLSACVSYAGMRREWERLREARETIISRCQVSKWADWARWLWFPSRPSPLKLDSGRTIYVHEPGFASWRTGNSIQW